MRPSMRLSAAHFILLTFLFAFLFCTAPVQAQEEEEPAPSPEPPTETSVVDPGPSFTTTAGGEVPTESPLDPTPTGPIAAPLPTTPPTASPVPRVPDPVFSSTDNCNACKPEYPLIRNCSDRLPTTGNLTVINQVLPFYACMCPNNGIALDALQKCSLCLRSTGQQWALNPQFYNITNPQLAAMKQMCVESAGGTTIPTGSGSGRWDMLASSAMWIALAAVALTLGEI
ncbi:hypothetical protein BGZ70_000038 [Mortierella alpina]|uniref:Uncharacterized protein n=1 Tax=Mortierella alpina TaxID=64518 RepID=A0A9P6JIS6_MORAP|nr:hypothetical protein BGZ70_000038 [Mortierella alpina]